MEHKYRINTIQGREILDSRGNPTIDYNRGIGTISFHNI